MKIVKCAGCGKMAAIIKDSACPTKCCGEPMQELIANTTEAAFEKHIPSVSVSGKNVIVRVGEVDHPMIPEHYIEWVLLETKEGRQRKALEPGSEPAVSFALTEADEPVAVYAYCNLHGLWKKDL